MDEAVHILKNRLNQNLNVFLLFIPAVVFVLSLALLIRFIPSQYLATNQEVSVLGDEAK